MDAFTAKASTHYLQCERVQAHAVAGLAHAESEARPDSSSAVSSVPAPDVAARTPEASPKLGVREETTTGLSPTQKSIVPSVRSDAGKPEGGPLSAPFFLSDVVKVHGLRQRECMARAH